MTFEFRPGVRDKTSTLIALAGPTGCGKTFTAILMAIGIAYPDMTNEEIIAAVRAEGQSRVFFIDSEGGRGLHYAAGPGMEPDFIETFPYQYGEITAPYTPERYKEATEAAERAGAWVIIIDSMSHEYESEGGILEIADRIEAGTPKPGIANPRDPFSRDGWQDWAAKPVKSPGNWNEPKTRHKHMVNRMVQLRAHLIFCLRAEEKMLMKMEPIIDERTGEPKIGRGGQPMKKSIIIPAEDRPLLDRWAPICEKRFMYEMTCSFLLLPQRPGAGIPIKTLQGAFKDIFADAGPDGKRLGRDHGEALAHWSIGRKKGGERPVARSGPSLSDSPAQTMGYADQPDQRDDRPPADPPARQDPPPRQERKQSKPPTTTPQEWQRDFIDRVKATKSLDELKTLRADSDKSLMKLADVAPELHEKALEEVYYQQSELEFRAEEAAEASKREGVGNGG